jgi:hypothetical protein
MSRVIGTIAAFSGEWLPVAFEAVSRLEWPEMRKKGQREFRPEIHAVPFSFPAKLRQLRDLFLSKTKVTLQAATELKKSVPECTIWLEHFRVDSSGAGHTVRK